MWSINRNQPTSDRHVDIACRRSTPNGLDDDIGQELGELNQLLSHRFTEPVPPPATLTWAAARDLILSQPAPAPAVPWYKTVFAPGRLAVATVTASLVYVLLAVVPVSTQSVPALEATVYARSDEATEALPPLGAMFDENSPLKRHQIRKIDVEETNTESGLRSKSVTIIVDGFSKAGLDSEIRMLNEMKSGITYTPTYRDGAIKERLTAIEFFKKRHGGSGFLPGPATQTQIEIPLGLEHLMEYTHMSPQDQHLLLLMEKDELLRKAQQDKARLEQQEYEVSQVKTTGKQP